MPVQIVSNPRFCRGTAAVRRRLTPVIASSVCVRWIASWRNRPSSIVADRYVYLNGAFSDSQLSASSSTHHQPQHSGPTVRHDRPMAASCCKVSEMRVPKRRALLGTFARSWHWSGDVWSTWRLRWLLPSEHTTAPRRICSSPFTKTKPKMLGQLSIPELLKLLV